MPRRPDSGHIDLAEIFRRVQQEMLAQLSVGALFEHPSAAGHATEHHWLRLFDRYLPKRYRAAPAFVIDSTGRRSRQIDIAIFDNLYTPPLFPHSSGLHLPAESVYAVFEVKPTFSRQWLRDAAEKAASVRSLRRTSVSVIGREATKPPAILAGLLATTSVWTPRTFAANLRRARRDPERTARGALDNAGRRSRPAALCALERLDIGCCLEHGSFEDHRISSPDDSLVFFIIRLLDRLRAMGTAPAIDWSSYFR
jgi:Domain of unknown function (DUF6602)